MNPWTTVVQQWTPSGFCANKSADGMGNLLSANSNEQRDALVQTVGIDLTTDFYRQTLIAKFRKDFPDDLASMQTFMQGKIQQAKDFQAYADAVANVGDVNRPLTLANMSAFPDNSSMTVATSGVFGVVSQLFPRLFIVQAPVTNSLLVGVAGTGEFLGVGSAATGGDMPAQRLYINQGTMAVPNWVAFTDDSLIDFLINPQELLTCGYERTLMNLRAYSMDVPVGARIEWSYTYMPPAIKTQLTRVQELEEKAFGLLRPSLDGTGIATDFIKSTGKRRKAFF